MLYDLFKSLFLDNWREKKADSTKLKSFTPYSNQILSSILHGIEATFKIKINNRLSSILKPYILRGMLKTN
jgi:hypothetical protein